MKLWRHIDFQDGGHRVGNLLPGNDTRLERWKSTGILNFDEMSESTAEIKLLPVSENGRLPFWNFISGFYFCLIFVIWVSFFTGLPNFVNIELPLAEL